MQAKAILASVLASVRPRDLAGKTRRRLATEQLAELVVVDKKIKALTKELKVMVVASGSRLMDLPGSGRSWQRGPWPTSAMWPGSPTATGSRPADRTTGPAPIEASSGEIVRHRLSRAGNRRMNHMIHIAAASQVRVDTPGRAYYRRKLAAGKTRAEAMRCLKRRISDAVYRRLLGEAAGASAASLEAAPGGHRGETPKSSAAGLHPHTGTLFVPVSPFLSGSPGGT